jgi:predicted nucleic acid-binding protein
LPRSSPLYIAATAIDAGATLVTNDHALLDGTIPGLAVENWA